MSTDAPRTSAQPLTEQSSAWRSLLTMNSWMGRLISRRYKLKFASERDNSPDGGTGGPSGEENDLLRPDRRGERGVPSTINPSTLKDAYFDIPVIPALLLQRSTTPVQPVTIRLFSGPFSKCMTQERELRIANPYGPLPGESCIYKHWVSP